MRKAYIIIAHKNPGQLARLIARLNDGKSEFFVHIDQKAAITEFEHLKQFGSVLHFLERFDAKWGSLGTIKPYMDGLATILNSEDKFDRIILLSGQDYPIKSNKQIDAFFRNSVHSVFLNYFPIPNYAKWPGNDRGGLYRTDKYYFGNKWYESFASRSLNLAATYLPFLRRKPPGGLAPFTGQTWWILDDYAARYVLTYHQQHPEYIKFHQNTFVADELFVQMIIANSGDRRLLESIENSEKRFTIWEDERDAHPKMLSTADYEAIAASDDLFARKFDDTADATILNLIDNHLLNHPVS